jgi:hypothetical protein
MANEHGLFWDSYGGDRLYNAESMEEWLKPFFVTGVFNGHLQVTATSGMTVSVAPGYCNIKGKVKYYQNATTLTLEASSGTARTDNIVIERNDGDRTISLKVVKNGGAPIRESGIYQLVLAQITIAADATSITQEDILDTRWDSELCGYVVSTVDEVNFDQMAAQFNEWFINFKSHLDGDIAANLQAEIDNLDAWSNITLLANNWIANDGIYIYSLEEDYPSSDYDITEIIPGDNTTTQMKNAWLLADCGGQSNSNIIKCYGIVPEIDIELKISTRFKGVN